MPEKLKELNIFDRLEYLNNCLWFVNTYQNRVESALEDFLEQKGSDYAAKSIKDAWEDCFADDLQWSFIDAGEWVVKLKRYFDTLVNSGVIRPEDKLDAAQLLNSLLDYPCTSDSYKVWKDTVIGKLRNMLNIKDTDYLSDDEVRDA